MSIFEDVVGEAEREENRELEYTRLKSIAEAKRVARDMKRLKRHLSHKGSSRHRRKANRILNKYSSTSSIISTILSIGAV